MMRRYLTSALGLLFAGGCATATHPPPVGPVPISVGSLRDFSPLVPPSTGIPRCEVVDGAEGAVATGAVAWVYSDPADQQVTVIRDPDGVPIRYTDVRGDLSITADAGGDRTTIGLYLAEGYAVLSNRPAGSRPTILEVPLDEALYADELGNPGTMLDRLLDACG